MSEFVSRNEFNSLKQEVQELKTEMDENKKILVVIDKKIDVITEKIANGEKIDELTLKPLNKRVSDLEESYKWLQRTVGATLIGIAIKIFIEVSKYIAIK